MASCSWLASAAACMLMLMSIMMLICKPAAAIYPQLSTSSPPIFVFGASMVDAGENAAAMPLRASSEFPPYGSDYFGKPVGRWSNGRTLVDLMTEALGYGHIPAYLRSVGSNFTYGANFASSGSTASNSSASGDDSAGLFCLLVQVDQFRDFQASVMSSQHGLEAKENTMRQQFAKSIYFFETGHNDYISTVSESFDLNATVLATIAAMKTAFQVMYGVGARTFIIMNLTPLGCTPGVLSFPGTGVSEDVDENNCNAYWMDIVGTHNVHLSLLLDELRTDYPGAEWILFDAYSLFLDGYINPSNYGIKYPFQACCGAGGPYNYNAYVECGWKAQTINGTYVEWTKCEDPTQHLIWDSIHPTESFAYYVAQGVLNGTYLIPSVSLMERVQSLKKQRGELAVL